MACEVLIVNQACKHIIRNRGTFFLRNVITTGKKFGMISMSTSMQGLVDERRDHARDHGRRDDQLQVTGARGGLQAPAKFGGPQSLARNHCR